MTDWAKKANWLWAAGIFTAVYLIGALWIVGPVRIWTFVTTGFLNEVGDFLSGVFSPLAFIWLVAAVLTQRQELDETRDQFGENQKVVDAQMKTISSQNELLALQHQQAEASAKQTYKLNLFDKRFELFNRLTVISEAIPTSGVDWKTAEGLRKISLESVFVFSYDIHQHLSSLTTKTYAYLQGYAALSVDDEYGNQILSRSAEHSGLVQELAAKREAIISALTPASILSLMSPSMSVSDD